MSNYITDDAMHIEFPVKNINKDFEWWYFDAALDSDDYIVVMYSINDTRLNPRQPSVRVNIYPTNQPEIWEINEYKKEDVSVSYDKCDVKMGEEFCRDMGEYYEIYTNINGNGGYLKFYPQKPSFVRPESWWVMGWTVAVPTAKVEGYLLKDNKKVDVKGHGYHDHNWGSKPMSSTFKNWFWGKVHTDEFTIDYSVMIPHLINKPLLALLVIDKNGAIFEPTMTSALFQTNVNLSNYKIEEEMGYSIPHSLILKGKNKNCKIKLTIEIDKFVMIEKSKFQTGENAYRYLGNEVLEITQGDDIKTFKTNSLHEIVYLLK